MFNPTETEERAYLEEVKAKLREAHTEINSRLSEYANQVQEQKDFFWANKTDMDRAEMAFTRETVAQTMRTGDTLLAARHRLERLAPSPYFGRIDFVRRDSQGQALPVYIGMHSFDDPQRNVVFDWRAPISTLFYDFELGQATYRAPGGVIHGAVTLKRQFRIRKGRMEFMIESGLNIMDNLLQEELSRTSDERMKTIVATIQRDQNAIIRNEEDDVLIIQGVAGSGKTSIALHRVAFLLYRFKDQLTAKDVLILSPNKVFADFISNVLPELGEEPIAEMGMESLALGLLGERFRFETFFEQSQALSEGKDPALQQRVEAKSSFAFLQDLDKYVEHIEATRFSPVDIAVGGVLVPAAFVEHAYNRQGSWTPEKRIPDLVASVEYQVWRQSRVELTAQERTTIRAAVKSMFSRPALRTLYKKFFQWLGRPELFAGFRATLEYADVFPLIYLALRLEGAQSLETDFQGIQHLIVDEMQDYTAVQYAVLARLFPCRKTILGDISQSLNPWSPTTAQEIARVFRSAHCLKLTKSYRSSYEITQFAQSISPDPDLEPVERHGSPPRVHGCANQQQQLDLIRETLRRFSQGTYRTMGILCKTQRQAEELFGELGETTPPLHLLSASSSAFVQGAVICSPQLAKGLEFDLVLVTNASAQNYCSGLDRNLLYVACTRAMHELHLTHVGERTPFIR